MTDYTKCNVCGDCPTRLHSIDFDTGIIERQCQNKTCLHIQEEIPE